MGEPDNIRIYNEKQFLLPESIKSMAGYHAKVMPDGTYMFRIHDCITGIRLIGNVTDQQDATEGVAKLRTLAAAANKMADFIDNNYVTSKE